MSVTIFTRAANSVTRSCNFKCNMPSQRASSEASAGRKRKHDDGLKKSKRSRKIRKTLSAKQKRAIVTDTFVSLEAKKFTVPFASRSTQPHSPSTGGIHPSRTEIVPSTVDGGGHTSVAAPSAEAAATQNLKKPYSKAELALLTRIAEDSSSLQQLIPDHPRGDIDWEVVSRFLGRYSKGGVAVKQQYYAVVRLLKEARREGKKGSSYVDLIVKAFEGLPNRSGTVFDLHKVLKGKEFKPHLDKYKGKNGVVKWKETVRQVLSEETGKFEIIGKSVSGKHIWRLKKDWNGGDSASDVPAVPL
jgi:hypothetical protein